MNPGAGLVCGLAGAVIGAPAAAIAHSVPPQGHVALARAWWLGQPASFAHVIAVVLMTGLSGGAVGFRMGWSLVLPAYWVLAVVGVVLAVVDIRFRRLPYIFTVHMYAVCLVCFGLASIVAADYTALVRSVIAGAVTFTGFLMLALLFAGQLALGDVVLVGSLAVSLGWLGWERVALGLIAGLIAGLISAVIVGVVQIMRRKVVRETLPLGPALLAGWLVGVLVTA